MVDGAAEEVVRLSWSLRDQSLLTMVLWLSCPQKLPWGDFSAVFVAGLAVLSNWLQ